MWYLDIFGYSVLACMCLVSVCLGCVYGVCMHAVYVVHCVYCVICVVYSCGLHVVCEMCVVYTMWY